MIKQEGGKYCEDAGLKSLVIAFIKTIPQRHLDASLQDLCRKRFADGKRNQALSGRETWVCTRTQRPSRFSSTPVKRAFSQRCSVPFDLIRASSR